MTTKEVLNKYTFKPTALMYELGEVAKLLKEDVENWHYSRRPGDSITNIHIGYIGTTYLPHDLCDIDKRRKNVRSEGGYEELRRKIDRGISIINDKDEKFCKNYPIDLMCHCKRLHDTYIAGNTSGPIDDAMLIMDCKYDNSEKFIYTDGEIIESDYNNDDWDCRFLKIENYHLLLLVEDYYKDSEMKYRSAALAVY